MATEIGGVTTCDIVRSENDTDDIVVHLTNADGTDATVIGWTAVLSIGPDADNVGSGYQATYTGTGIAGGLIPIDMNPFNVPDGSYKYDIRITDTVTGDTPARVYFRGKFKVNTRID